MTLTSSILLTEEFAEFSGKVTALHEKKKEAITEFKKLYENHKKFLKTLDEEALKHQFEFNAWVAEKDGKDGKDGKEE